MVIDLGGILSIDPVGTAQWRKLMQLLGAKTGGDGQVERVNFLSIPAPFLERLGEARGPDAQGQVLSLLIPNCSRCRATTQRLVDFSQHGDELRLGRVPRIKCGICNGPVTCVVSETWFSRLQTLPQTTVSDELQRTLARLTAAPPPASPKGAGDDGTGDGNPGAATGTADRGAAGPGLDAAVGDHAVGGDVTGFAAGTAHDDEPLGTAASAAMPRPEGRNSLLTAAGPAMPAPPTPAPPPTFLGKLFGIPGILPGLLIVILSLSGAVVYKILAAPSGRGALEWKVVRRRCPRPRHWHDPRFVSKSDHTFIGHSPLVPRQSRALERADVATQTELASRLGDALAAKYPEWRKTVQPLYGTVEQGLLDRR